MSFYKIKYSKAAEKFLRKNKLFGLKFYKAFLEIAEAKENLRKYDVKRYYSPDYSDIFRLRIGDYRAIFRVIDQDLYVFVVAIGSRGDAYKK